MEFSVPPSAIGSRLDVFLKNFYPQISRSNLQHAIKNGHCLLDNSPILDPAFKIRYGQTIKIDIPDNSTKLIPAKGELNILWQDEHIAICVKPPGVVMHPCPSFKEETFIQQLLSKFPQLASQGGERPGIAHRLDKDTSGLIMVALDEATRLKLSEMFASRQIHKEYLALVSGIPPEKGECREHLGRHPTLKTRMAVVSPSHGGRPSHTEWHKLWNNDTFSLLRIVLHTGRTHQIRVHMAHLGYPLLGDGLYAPPKIGKMAPRQMLHATRLVFTHPFTHESLDFSLAPPQDFYNTLIENAHNMQKIVVTGNQGCGKSSFCKFLAANGLPVSSADQIVKELYAGKSDATYWIEKFLGSDAINADHSVNKERLFFHLQKRPDLKYEFEKAIHGMVQNEIDKFWQANRNNSAAVAEIPLYFESDIANQDRCSALVVGINCPQEKRWDRIRKNRGWSQEKIETIEHWQWPEEKKMSACDVVIDNSGDENALEREAKNFIEFIRKRCEFKKSELLKKVKVLCADEQD